MTITELFAWCAGGSAVAAAALLLAVLRMARKKKRESLVDAILKIAERMEK